MRCHVTVEAPHRHQHQGMLFDVRIDITVTGKEIAIRQAHPASHAHEDPYVALRDAFRAARRKLQDYERELRLQVKTHVDLPRGRICELNPGEDFGRIETDDGRLIYFHRHSVLGPPFDKLTSRYRSTLLRRARRSRTAGQHGTRRILSPGGRPVNNSAPSDLSRFIWETRYRDLEAQPPENSIADSWRRVAQAVAAIEPDPALWQERFLSILRDFRFLPGGRILAGAGTTPPRHAVQLLRHGSLDDSVAGIFEALKEGALTMQQGGGVGYDFSTLRPRGSRARSTGTVASGPVSFMARVGRHVRDDPVHRCAPRRDDGDPALRSSRHRGIHRCQARGQALRHFNLSVLVTDAFMQAVKNDAAWPLVFPEPALSDSESAGRGNVERPWSGSAAPVRCRIRKVVRARELWTRLCESAFDTAEPGVLFIDRINAANNLAYCEHLSATNPCAEEPLPPYGACNLGSLNLTTFVVDAFGSAAHIDAAAIAEAARVAVRFLDDVIDISRFPLLRQDEQVQRSRRIGLGVTGLADALAMLGLRYDSEPARVEAADIMRTIRDAAYEASIELARERGVFPAYEAEQYCARPFIRSLPEVLQAALLHHGIRNSHLLAIAPAGTISLLAHNVSSGIEPMFGIQAQRRVLGRDGTQRSFQPTDHAYAAWRARNSGQVDLPDYFVDAEAIAPRDHLLMQAALQPFVDGAISKTITLGHDCSRAQVTETLESAYDLGLKGCTVYRRSARAGVLKACARRLRRRPARDAHCCETEREND